MLILDRIYAGKITAKGLEEGVIRVLAEPSFGEAAEKVSVRMRAHRLTPAQKAAGAVTCPHLL